eukprot:CAMPEP_0113899904 /NCGR_PEP_ID=MMETSP0780_2-20120614/20340_1 /TAXON_ID=652834 /ORGANISM="Palpitomonas bilix" /LENGTH=302 /DNA_ID=CAMNT_0000892223 /DNA_START=188 /DNA_END=1096 /DNA_ORIENTATION=- /assembly_acc=CAM_ASM_000599
MSTLAKQARKNAAGPTPLASELDGELAPIQVKACSSRRTSISVLDLDHLNTARLPTITETYRPRRGSVQPLDSNLLSGIVPLAFDDMQLPSPSMKNRPVLPPISRETSDIEVEARDAIIAGIAEMTKPRDQQTEKSRKVVEAFVKQIESKRKGTKSVMGKLRRLGRVVLLSTKLNVLGKQAGKSLSAVNAFAKENEEMKDTAESLGNRMAVTKEKTAKLSVDLESISSDIERMISACRQLTAAADEKSPVPSPRAQVPPPVDARKSPTPLTPRSIMRKWHAGGSRRSFTVSASRPHSFILSN